MSCFVDTSAFLAVLNEDDENHSAAGVVWSDLLGKRTSLVTSSYALIETCAIVQHRLGLDAIRVFHSDVYPVLTVEWVVGALHEKAMAGTMAARRRDLSLVDCVSFEIMRHRGLRRVFAFDSHFAEQGFDVVPD